jgi:hypothetical protein
MSRTYKDRKPRKYKLGEDWYNREYTRGRERNRIDNDPVSGNFYKKQTYKLDEYGGL